jgi:hypothetical protein
MTFSWADKVVPEPAADPQSHGSAYAEWQRNKSANGASGSYIYSTEYQAAINGQRTVSRPDLYAGSPQYQGLQSYARTTRSKHEPREGESAFGYLQRVDRPAFLQHMADELPEDEFARVQAAVEQARQQVAEGVGDHAALRERLENRTSGTGIGLFTMNADARAAAWNGRPNITGQEHLSAPNSAPARPASMADVRAAIQAKDLAQRGQQPQRQSIPAGSSGTGFLGVDR